MYECTSFDTPSTLGQEGARVKWVRIQSHYFFDEPVKMFNTSEMLKWYQIKYTMSFETFRLSKTGKISSRF